MLIHKKYSILNCFVVGQMYMAHWFITMSKNHIQDRKMVINK